MKCKRCSKEISKKEKYARLETWDKEKLKEQINWHFVCYLEWIQESINNRAMKLFQDNMQVTMKSLSNVLGQIKQ